MFPIAPLSLEAAFDGGRITSDGGMLWLAEADGQLGLCEAIAEHAPEWRGGRWLRHLLLALVRQRVYQIACGYEDQNDADTLRKDPLLKLVLGRLPETGAVKTRVVTPDTQLVIEGFPRSGNTFARRAFVMAQSENVDQTRITSHSKSTNNPG